jgi:hypothetical protein
MWGSLPSMRTIHAILRDIEYKPGWDIELVPGLYDTNAIQISWAAVDAMDPTKLTTIYKTCVVDFAFQDEGLFLEWLFYQIMEAERHEAREWFKFKGKAIYNEHDEQARRFNQPLS